MNFDETIKEVLLKEGFARLDSKLAKSFAYKNKRTMDNIFSPPTNDNDINIELLDRFIKDLQSIREKIKITK